MCIALIVDADSLVKNHYCNKDSVSLKAHQGTYTVLHINWDVYNKFYENIFT